MTSVAAPHRLVDRLWYHWIAIGLVIAAGIAAYANSLHGAYVYDDVQCIEYNPDITRLGPPFGWLTFCPPRFVVYFTFAVNYAIHGTDVVGYHLANVAIHIATALVLFGLVRRTLQRPGVSPTLQDAAETAAAMIALLWVVHPLNTQAVTYVYQRLESLAALFAIVSLYSFLRAYGEAATLRRGWRAVSVIACYMAMASKESVVALPLITLCFDRLFVASSWREIGSRRRYYYALLFASWAMLAALTAANDVDYAKVGLIAVEGMTPWKYAISEARVLLYYLKLAFIPTRLTFYYKQPPAELWSEFVPQSLCVLGLLATAMVGFVRGRAWSFPALAFFLLLAPTSSFLPIMDLLQEHRMYLPLACVLTLAVCGVIVGVRWIVDRSTTPAYGRVLHVVGGGAFAAVFVLLLLGTIRRNRDYDTGLTMWLDIAAKSPHSAHGSELVACYYFAVNNQAEGRRWLHEALRIEPNYPWAVLKQAGLLIDEHRFDEAERFLAGRPLPPSSEAAKFVVLGRLRSAQGRRAEAAQCYLKSIELNPKPADAMTNIGVLLYDDGRIDEAAALFQEALSYDPAWAPAHANLGTYYAATDRLPAAVDELREALRLAPFDAAARSHLGSVLDRLGRGDEALAELERAVIDDPRYAEGFINLGNALARRGRFDAAVGCYERSLALKPDGEHARQFLAAARRDLETARGGSAVERGAP